MSAKLIILGSAGGPTPKLGRNSTAHALTVDGATTVIDCGSGVTAQLVRAGISLASLERIVITHHHIDHVADFGLLLHLSWPYLRAPVELIGPPPIARMMQQYMELFSEDIRCRMADDKRRHLREFVEVREITSAGTILDDRHCSARAALVDHPPLKNVLAYRFDTPYGSVAFSADTVPTPNLAELARGADVLVHEAVYLDDARDALPPARADNILERMIRAHSLPEDAGRIAQAAGVSRLVLSPLGAFAPIDEQRLIDRAARHFKGDILVGRDLLTIDLCNSATRVST